MKGYKFSLVISVILLLTACSRMDEKSPEEQPDSFTHHESISEFLMALNHAFQEVDLKSFQSYIDEYGLYSITYFSDGRDRNKTLLVYKDNVRGDDLYLMSAQSNRGGISLSGFTYSVEIKHIHINDFIIENNALDNVDWRVENEQLIHDQLADIIKGCQELILLNNEFVPQIFRLTGNLYAFSYSDMDDEDYAKFYGYWIIFEEIDESYFIRAIIELQ